MLLSRFAYNSGIIMKAQRRDEAIGLQDQLALEGVNLVERMPIAISPRLHLRSPAFFVVNCLSANFLAILEIHNVCRCGERVRPSNYCSLQTRALIRSF